MRPLHNLKILLLSLFLLVGCEQSNIINDNVREAEKEAKAAIDTISPDTARRTPLQVIDRPWFGSEAIPMKNGNDLPRSLSASNALTMTFAGAVSFDEATRMIESVTNIPVRVSNNIYESSLGSIAERKFLPTGGQEVSGGRIVWSGSLQNILNQLSNQYSSEWEYNNNMIVFKSEHTKTFMLNALSNEMKLTDNTSSTAGGGESNVPEIKLDGTTTLEIWGEISGTIESIIGDAGKVTFSPSTGSITVTARQDVLRRVENYLRYQNQKRLRRIAVSVKVLSIETSDTSEYGFDISGVIKAALGNGLTVSGSSNGSDGLDFSILKNPTGANSSGDVTAAISATEGVQRVNIVHSGSLVTLSDQPAPLQVSRQIAYLERVSSSGGEASSVSLEPGTIDVGLFMTVLPRIVEDDRILMRLSMAITDADRNFRTFGTDELQIELPEIDTTGFLQNAVMGDGETMVLAGFEKSTNSLDGDTNPFGYLLGGSQSTNRGREMLVLLINSRILPEQPLTVIGR